MFTSESDFEQSSLSSLMVLRPALGLGLGNPAGEAGPVGEGVAEEQYL